MWKIATSIEFAIESKSIQKFAFYRTAAHAFEQKPDKCQFQNQVCHPCNALKSKSFPCFYTPGKFEANAAFTTFAINAKLWQI